MSKIGATEKQHIITFKRKDLRPNQRDDKFEIFRHAIGLEDTNDILDLSRYKGSHMHDEIQKTPTTVTDINKYDTPFIITKLTIEQANRLRKDPNIEDVSVSVVATITEELVGWQIVRLKAKTAWNPPLGKRGAGVNVCVIDTGCDPHTDFGPNLKVNQNFTAESGTKPQDDHHHGTHCCGIIGAAQGNDIGIQGVAPSANIWNLKAGTKGGGLDLADVIPAMTYAVQNGGHILSMSFAANETAPPWVSACLSAYNAGLLLFAATGNDGIQKITYPAAHEGVNGVSNTMVNNTLSPTSTYGSHVVFTGPGTDITSLAEGNTYRVLSGTSMACPAIAGVAALCLSAYRDNGCPPYTVGAKKNQVIEQVMKDTCDHDLTNWVGQRTVSYGFGMPNADKAVAALMGVLPAAVPTTS